ncbi:MAG: hypothetical protein ACRCVW_05050 [Brevinema sp.]
MDTYKDCPVRSLEFVDKNKAIWIHDKKLSYYVANIFHKTGYFQKSNAIAFELLAIEHKKYYRNNLYFLIAKNYDGLAEENNARAYFQKLTSNNHYHLYTYAKFEEKHEHFSNAIDLYQKALSKRNLGYISYAYRRTLEKALIFYKKHDPTLYKKYLTMTESLSNFSTLKLIVIKKSIII